MPPAGALRLRDDRGRARVECRKWLRREADHPAIDPGQDCYLAHPSLLPIPAGLRARAGAAIRCSLLDHHGHEQKPAWARPAALFEAGMRSAGIDIASRAATDRAQR
ncbi:hypothetical protein GCM10023259_098920 [Thermocatellispora tengchongensis]